MKFNEKWCLFPPKAPVNIGCLRLKVLREFLLPSQKLPFGLNLRILQAAMKGNHKVLQFWSAIFPGKRAPLDSHDFSHLHSQETFLEVEMELLAHAIRGVQNPHGKRGVDIFT